MCSWTRVSRFSPQAHTSVAAVSEVVQRSERRLAEIMGSPRFEAEAAGDGEMNGSVLMVPHLVGRTPTERYARGDMEMERSVRLEVREAKRW